MRRTVGHRAVGAIIRDLPQVGGDAVEQAYFCDGKPNDNDIVWWAKGGGRKNQSRTANVNLALHSAQPEMVPRVWPGEGDVRQELEVAGP